MGSLGRADRQIAVVKQGLLLTLRLWLESRHIDCPKLGRSTIADIGGG